MSGPEIPDQPQPNYQQPAVTPFGAPPSYQSQYPGAAPTPSPSPQRQMPVFDQSFQPSAGRRQRSTGWWLIAISLVGFGMWSWLAVGSATRDLVVNQGFGADEGWVGLEADTVYVIYDDVSEFIEVGAPEVYDPSGDQLTVAELDRPIPLWTDKGDYDGEFAFRSTTAGEYLFVKGAGTSGGRLVIAESFWRLLYQKTVLPFVVGTVVGLIGIGLIISGRMKRRRAERAHRSGGPGSGGSGFGGPGYPQPGIGGSSGGIPGFTGPAPGSPGYSNPGLGSSGPSAGPTGFPGAPGSR